jgi:hypothetical protein
LERRLGGELVGAALGQQRGVDECVVIQPQQTVDAVLCAAHRAFRKAPPGFRRRVPGLQLEQREGGFLLDAALADHQVTRPGHLKLQRHPGLAQVLMDQVVGRGRPRLAPQRPGDRIQQRGFPRAVFAGDAGDMDALQVQGIRIAVGEEVVQLEFDGNHGSVESISQFRVNSSAQFPTMDHRPWTIAVGLVLLGVSRTTRFVKSSS